MPRLLSGPSAGYLAGIVAAIGAVVLAALGKSVPSELWQLAALGIGAGAGGTVPTRFVETSSTPGPAGVK